MEKPKRLELLDAEIAWLDDTFSVMKAGATEEPRRRAGLVKKAVGLESGMYAVFCNGQLRGLMGV